MAELALNRDAVKYAIARIRLIIATLDSGCVTEEQCFRMIAQEVMDACGKEA